MLELNHYLKMMSPCRFGVVNNVSQVAEKYLSTCNNSDL